MSWFAENHRTFPWRTETDPYRILIAEKMLQQTSYRHVLKVYDKFIHHYPDLKALSGAGIDDVRNVIKPLGFHNQRSEQLVEMAIILGKQEFKVPNTREELLMLPGVGEYIADAVCCFAYNQQVPVIDVNVRRVFNRVIFDPDRKDKELRPLLTQYLPQGCAKKFNWAVIDFSSIVCSRKPKCSKCFALSYCGYNIQM